MSDILEYITIVLTIGAADDTKVEKRISKKYQVKKVEVEIEKAKVIFGGQTNKVINLGVIGTGITISAKVTEIATKVRALITTGDSILTGIKVVVEVGGSVVENVSNISKKKQRLH